MTIELTKEAKNNLGMTMEDRVTSPTFDESVITFDESLPETFDSQSTLFAKEAKNNLGLTLENK